MSHHRAALVNLGFLIERRISVTNRVAICSLVAPFEFWSGESGLRFFVERFDWLEADQTTIVVTARPGTMPQWEAVIQKEDVPPWNGCGTCQGLIE